MGWSPDREALRGRVAVVAGATRGAGRGIAAALGEAGATVISTGRTTRVARSEYDRPETIEETAQWNTPIWQLDLDLDTGLRILRLAVETHLVTSHYLLPLVIDRPGGLLVEVTDGTAEYNATHYRISVFYDLAKMMLDNFGVTEQTWRDAVDPARARRGPSAPPDFALSESPRYVGRGVAALAADPDRARWNQRWLSSGQLACEYGFTDLDGSRPDIWRYIGEVRERGRDGGYEGYR